MTLPPMTEAAAHSDVERTQQVLRDAERALDRAYRHGSATTALEASVQAARRELSAAELRREAIRSQQPERHMKAWDLTTPQA